MLKIGSYILLFYLAFRLSKHSFEFEKVSRLELIILPLYSTLMFFITMTWGEENIMVAIILLVWLYALPIVTILMAINWGRHSNFD